MSCGLWVVGCGLRGMIMKFLLFILVLMDAKERLEKLRVLVNELPQPNLEIFKRFMCHLNR